MNSTTTQCSSNRKVCTECDEGEPLLDSRKYQSRDRTPGVSFRVQGGEEGRMALKEFRVEMSHRHDGSKLYELKKALTARKTTYR